jgi:chromosome partitioning protein
VRVTAVLNQKGGVGKTALSVGVAGALAAEQGRRVLLVDLDPQGHATTEALQLAEAEDRAARLAAALPGEYTGPAGALSVRHSTYGTGLLDVWPTSVDMFLVGRKLEQLRARKEDQLQRLLADVAGDYDHAVIDCPPALDVLTDNALTAADGVLIPVQLDPSMLRALRLLFDQIDSLEAMLRRVPIDLHGLVPGVYRRPRTKLAESVLTKDLGSIGLPILAHLPLAVAVPEAWRAGQPLTVYAPDHENSAALRGIAKVLEAAA